MLSRLLRRPGGEFAEFTEDGKLVREGQTVMCEHCGAHFELVRGSGKRRGYCQHCAGPTCGRPACDTCDSWERKIARIEQQQALWRSMGEL
jgi:hypothetical protein